MNKNLRPWIIGCAVILTAMLGGGAAALLLNRTAPAPTVTPPAVTAEPAAAQETAAYDESDWDSTIEYEGAQWTKNDRLTTILFMGVDAEADTETGEGIGGGGRADAIFLAILDKDTGSLKYLPISRDTMIDVDVYDYDREFLYSGTMQLTMQYAFSDSPARSCQLMKRKVSELLYGTDIDYTCSVTIGGMAKITDAMGGIRIVMDDDWTEIESAYVQGAEIQMDGKAVERFLRYRDSSVTGSNDVRMSRHSWFLQQLMRQLGKRSEKELLSLYDRISDVLTTDLDAETLHALARISGDPEVLTYPGETRAGALHDEFYVDEQELRRLVIETFYQKVQ